ncbi:MAG: DUF1049 domain-containing protein [Thermodesulfobacteriota bacterium]|nr:DUF1049 domain-containing protein [Thermodesulfobacteriota bacterium]
MNYKTVLIVIISIIIFIIFLQNIEICIVNVLFWKIQIPRIIWMIITIVIGIIIGSLLAKRKKR